MLIFVKGKELLCLTWLVMKIYVVYAIPKTRIFCKPNHRSCQFVYHTVFVLLFAWKKRINSKKENRGIGY